MTAIKIQQDYVSENINERSFRDLMGRFATGVTVITTTDGDMDHGTTANAVTSVSTEPPTLLTCLNKSSNTGRAISRSGRFVVNILSSDQEALARSFAAKGGEKFSEVKIGRTSRGQVFLSEGLAFIECQVVESVSAATHEIVIGRVVTMARQSEEADEPLVFYRGKFGMFRLSN